MGNILFQDNPKPNNDVLAAITQIRSTGPSSVIFQQLYNNNPAFRNLADKVSGKTPEQAFAEMGLDFNQYRHLKW